MHHFFPFSFNTDLSFSSKVAWYHLLFSLFLADLYSSCKAIKSKSNAMFITVN